MQIAIFRFLKEAGIELRIRLLLLFKYKFPVNDSKSSSGGGRNAPKAVCQLPIN